MEFAGLFVAAYLVGAIPFGVLVARAKGIDIMKAGSGNIGATNVFRTLGVGPGLLVFILDAAKGWLPVFVAMQLLGDPFMAFLVGVGAFVGHCYSPYLRFRGGKGVATALGALIGVSPVCAGVALLVFSLALALTRYVSVSSITATGSVLACSFALPLPNELRASFGALFLFIVVKHRSNIMRLMQGTEPKIGRSSGVAASEDAKHNHRTSVSDSVSSVASADVEGVAPSSETKG